eukprot:TRINITY_DN4120_c0_g1_i9.p1 TRINITY_DN4120_c0_g1~~TRINITY_DN4120_c0_g1_i9.p1  ORF type:complete len:146 (+),score=6.08 TRINITY_DN4120_c0_g1_i9:1462-1899(+)
MDILSWKLFKDHQYRRPSLPLCLRTIWLGWKLDGTLSCILLYSFPSNGAPATLNTSFGDNLGKETYFLIFVQNNPNSLYPICPSIFAPFAPSFSLAIFMLHASAISLAACCLLFYTLQRPSCFNVASLFFFCSLVQLSMSSLSLH